MIRCSGTGSWPLQEVWEPAVLFEITWSDQAVRIFASDAAACIIPLIIGPSSVMEVPNTNVL